ncbi:hypothetical protein P7K49_004385 [Saguinus oedipus]|uniref:Uncharacterized protein n=1 Tax=Saguinus oedipus TaxID=9490 RepID=A0ABQ9W783_SAGOE|nr:hypothetical protein P7K49_004385 [Saguinus oedipus]
MRLRGCGPRAAPASSAGAGDARLLAPPGRNPFVHELRLSALQKAQVGASGARPPEPAQTPGMRGREAPRGGGRGGGLGRGAALRAAAPSFPAAAPQPASPAPAPDASDLAPASRRPPASPGSSAPSSGSPRPGPPPGPRNRAHPPVYASQDPDPDPGPRGSLDPLCRSPRSSLVRAPPALAGPARPPETPERLPLDAARWREGTAALGEPRVRAWPGAQAAWGPCRVRGMLCQVWSVNRINFTQPGLPRGRERFAEILQWDGAVRKTRRRRGEGPLAAGNRRGPAGSAWVSPLPGCQLDLWWPEIRSQEGLLTPEQFFEAATASAACGAVQFLGSTLPIVRIRFPGRRRFLNA